MGDRYLARQLVQLGFAANAFRPVPGGRVMLPAFFSGWLTAELAPHLAVLTALDTATYVGRRGVQTRRDAVALAVAAASVASYAALVAGGRRAADEIEDALLETLGPGYRDRIQRDPLPDDAGAPWHSLAMPFRMGNVEVSANRRLPYAPGGRRYEMDVFHHRDKPVGAPVLLQVHGGGWVLGSKDLQGVPLMMHMAARGWVCIAVNYPLSPKARWPDHLVALKRAMQWVRERSHEYGADPAFVAVTGGSAGGHLSSMLALTADDASLQPGFESVDTSVQACVPHYGVYDFTERHEDDRAPRVVVAGPLRDEPGRLLSRRLPRGLAAVPDDLGDAAVPRRARHERLAGAGRRGARVRRKAARHREESGGVRRDRGRPARVRHLPVAAQRGRCARRRAVPGVVSRDPRRTTGRARRRLIGRCPSGRPRLTARPWCLGW